MFRLPTARMEVVSSLAGSGSRWQATGEEVGDVEFVHAVAPAATLRVVLFPSSWGQSAANATADMLAGLRLAVSHTDVASISWSLGEHYFTKAQVAEMHAILLAAAARHVTVIASSGDGGWFSDSSRMGRPGQGGQPSGLRPACAGRWRHNTHRESQDRRLHRRDRLDRFGRRLQPPLRPSRLSGGRARDLNMRGACPMSPATLMRPTGWRGSTPRVARDTSGQPPAPATPRRFGEDSWRWPTSTPIATLAPSTPPSTASAAAPATTRRFTMSLRFQHCDHRHLTAVTRPVPDGTR